MPEGPSLCKPALSKSRALSWPRQDPGEGPGLLKLRCVSRGSPSACQSPWARLPEGARIGGAPNFAGLSSLRSRPTKSAPPPPASRRSKRCVPAPSGSPAQKGGTRRRTSRRRRQMESDDADHDPRPRRYNRHNALPRSVRKRFHPGNGLGFRHPHRLRRRRVVLVRR